MPNVNDGTHKSIQIYKGVVFTRFTILTCFTTHIVFYPDLYIPQDKLELNDRLSAVEEDYNRVAANNDEMNLKFDRERVITGEVRKIPHARNIHSRA